MNSKQKFEVGDLVEIDRAGAVLNKNCGKNVRDGKPGMVAGRLKDHIWICFADGKRTVQPPNILTILVKAKQ